MVALLYSPRCRCGAVIGRYDKQCVTCAAGFGPKAYCACCDLRPAHVIAQSGQHLGKGVCAGCLLGVVVLHAGWRVIL